MDDTRAHTTAPSASRSEPLGGAHARVRGVLRVVLAGVLLAAGSCIHPRAAGYDTTSAADGEASGVMPQDHVLEIPVTVHVAMRGDEAMVSRKRVVDALGRANRELRPWGVALVLRRIEALPDGLGRIENADHRARLAEIVQRDGSIHVFFVGRVVIGDRRHGDRRVSGLHWRYRGPRHELRNRTYLVVARDAPITTLIHEVGHAFGLTHEQHQRENIMCSCERTSNPTFTDTQGMALRLGAERFLQTGKLVGLTPREGRDAHEPGVGW